MTGEQLIQRHFTEYDTIIHDLIKQGWDSLEARYEAMERIIERYSDN